MSKEKKFYETLNNVFIGAKLEGEGGFINLMKIFLQIDAFSKLFNDKINTP